MVLVLCCPLVFLQNTHYGSKRYTVCLSGKKVLEGGRASAVLKPAQEETVHTAAFVDKEPSTLYSNVHRNELISCPILKIWAGLCLPLCYAWLFGGLQALLEVRPS